VVSAVCNQKQREESAIGFHRLWSAFLVVLKVRKQHCFQKKYSAPCATTASAVSNQKKKAGMFLPTLLAEVTENL
jgi:hypothetical protein